ncbi:hypothetical protein [Epilithonimonas hominis]|uniref:hypothetical protein n=1 Tax=Epilithonimonas hominis TaxID=420404 RepID=UPI002898B937|nr:hypothetical protein [Epilithonimonas hominis]
MKYKLLIATMGVASIDLHSNVFGNKKPYAKVDEESLQKVEDALAKNDTSALQTTITAHEATIATMQTDKTNVENAISEAFTMNGIEAPEGISIAEAIATLGTKCKEMGSSNNTHSIPQNDGKENNEADPAEQYSHNKVFDESKFKTLK